LSFPKEISVCCNCQKRGDGGDEENMTRPNDKDEVRKKNYRCIRTKKSRRPVKKKNKQNMLCWFLFSHGNPFTNRKKVQFGFFCFRFSQRKKVRERRKTTQTSVRREKLAKRTNKSGAFWMLYAMEKKLSFGKGELAKLNDLGGGSREKR